MARGLRVSEHQVGEAVLRILAASATGRMTITKLKDELPDHLALSDADRAPSPTRRNEEVWEQQVRNLVSHRATPGNIVHSGYVEYEPRWLSITDAGRIHVR
jgi:hypothetical protein